MPISVYPSIYTSLQKQTMVLKFASVYNVPLGGNNTTEMFVIIMY